MGSARLLALVCSLLPPLSTTLRLPPKSVQPIAPILFSPPAAPSSPVCANSPILGFSPPGAPAAAVGSGPSASFARGKVKPLPVQPAVKRAPLPPKAKRVGEPLKPRPSALQGSNATALYEKASRLLQLHRSREAADVLSRLTRLTPQDGRVWMKLMSTHKRARRLGKAQAVLRDGIRACPQNALLRQALADLCRDRRQYDEARAHFKRANELDPALASVYDSWGRMEASLGHNAVAASLYEKGLELKQTARLCHALGVLLDTQGHSARARQVLRRGLSLPNEQVNPQLLHALGMVEVRAGEHAAARGLFLSAIKEHPSFTRAYLSLGQLEERLGNKMAARRHYEAGATVKQPNGQLGAVQLWQAYARSEQRLGQNSAALALYKRAHALYPSDAQLLTEWAKLASEHGDPRVARDLFASLTESSDLATPYAFQCAAAFETRTGNVDAARALFARGEALPAKERTAREERMPLLHAWAVFEWRQGARRAARELFEKAEAEADEAEAPCGWLLQWHANFEADVANGGNPTLARHYYARAVNAAPLDSSAWRLWADFEEEHGDAERAESLGKHAQFVETQALLQDASGGTRRGGNPLSPADLYYKGR